MRVYAKVLSGQEGEAMRRILEAITETKIEAPPKKPSQDSGTSSAPDETDPDDGEAPQKGTLDD